MDTTGKRELLAWADQSLSQPVLVKARTLPPKIATQADYFIDSADFTIQDVYYGEGMKGITRGTAKKLRVVQLHYRVQGATTVGTVMGSAPAGAFMPAVFCPVSQYGGSWEAKTVLGETPIYPDGSASFKVPSRTPVYFQVIDSIGYCIATMRSWSTLQPGEKFPCLGCHENKLDAPPSSGIPQAGPPKALETLLGVENKPFDYPKMVQPVFDKHCVSCHNSSSHESGFDLSGTLTAKVGNRKAPLSYISLWKGIGSKSSNKALDINTIFSTPEQKAPYSFGACKSNIMTEVLYGSTHVNKIKTDLTDKEKRIVACWIDLCAPLCGNYVNYLSNADSIKYEKLMEKRLKWAIIEEKNINELVELTHHPLGRSHAPQVTSSIKKPSAVYIQKQCALVLKNAYNGKFMLIDLRGKVVSRMTILNQQSGRTLSIVLPAFLSTGVYVARFEGVKRIEQMKVTITK
jgi:hypothetical protein